MTTKSIENKLGELEFFVGTYTDSLSQGIYKAKLNKKGEISDIKLMAKTTNPSYLIISFDKKYLTCVNEVDDASMDGGMVTSFSIHSDSLHMINQSPSGGAHPCHISINKSNDILVSNYTSGSIGYLRLGKNGQLSSMLDVDKHYGSGPTERQKSPHAHSTYFMDEHRIITADLGTDELWISKISLKPLPKIHLDKRIPLPQGSGPRHIALHPNKKWLYVVNELNNTINVIQRSDDTTYLIRQTVFTLPDDYSGKSYCADIHLSPDNNFLYVSNRGHDSISVFGINPRTGHLSLVDINPVRGKWPRNFSITPNGEFLLVANQHSNNISVFKRNKISGKLKYISRKTIHTPVCIQF